MKYYTLNLGIWIAATFAHVSERIADRLTATHRERGSNAMEYAIIISVLFAIVLGAAIYIGNVITSRTEEIQP